MQRYVIIDTATKQIITVFEYDAAPSNPPPGFEAGIIAVQNDMAGPGWSWTGTELLPPPSPVIVPIVAGAISRRQFFQQLAAEGIVSQNDALAAVRTGALPTPLQTIVNGLPADQQFSAQMLLCGATEFQRSHPLTAAIGAAYGWTSEQIDTFFIAAVAL
jgi:hypothetical protein